MRAYYPAEHAPGRKWLEPRRRTPTLRATGRGAGVFGGGTGESRFRRIFSRCRSRSRQPEVPILLDERVVVEMGIRGVHAVDLFLLAGGEAFVGVEAPDPF